MAWFKKLAERDRGVTEDCKPRQKPALIRKASITEKCVNIRTLKHSLVILPLKSASAQSRPEIWNGHLILLLTPYQHSVQSLDPQLSMPSYQEVSLSTVHKVKSKILILSMDILYGQAAACAFCCELLGQSFTDAEAWGIFWCLHPSSPCSILIGFYF